MKNKPGFALFVIFALFALAFSVSNFVAPANAADPIVVYGTVTFAPQLAANPFNQIFHLYGDYYCINEESNCSTVTQY